MCFDLEHVERRARHVPGFDGIGERDLVDELAASGVDDPHPAFALGQPCPVEKMARFCRRGKMEADVIGDFAHAVEAEQLDAERGGDVLGNERVVRDGFHSKGARSSRDFLSDSSKPAKPEGLAAKFRAGQFLFVPHTALHRGVGGRDRPGERQHQRQRVLSDADAVSPWCVHHQDAAGAGRRQIDVVDARAGAGNHPKFGRGREQPLINLSGAADDQCIGLGKRRGKDVL